MKYKRLEIQWIADWKGEVQTDLSLPDAILDCVDYISESSGTVIISDIRETELFFRTFASGAQRQYIYEQVGTNTNRIRVSETVFLTIREVGTFSHGVLVLYYFTG